MKRKYKFLLASFLSVALLVGCSGGSGSNNDDGRSGDIDENKVKISGSFGSQYAYYQAPWYKSLLSTPLYASSSYDSIVNSVAIPLYEGHISIYDAVPLEIESDGSFSAEITKDRAWIVLLEKANKQYSFLSVPLSLDSNVSLMSFFPQSNLNFGKVAYKEVCDVVKDDQNISNMPCDEAYSDTNISIIAQKSIFNLDQLKEISTADDAFKAAMNSYRNNYKQDDKAFINEHLEIVFVLKDQLITSDYSLVDDYHGFGINFEFGSKSPLAKSIDDVCNNINKVALYFPDENISLYTADHNFTGELLSTNMIIYSNPPTTGCSNGIINLKTDNPAHGGMISFFSQESQKTLAQNSSLPKGLFSLQLEKTDTNTTVGEFALDYSLPLKNQKLLLPTPKLKIHTNEDGEADYCLVQWVVYNPASNSYEAVEDFTPFAESFSNLTANMWYQTTGSSGYKYVESQYSRNYDRIIFPTKVKFNDVDDFRLFVQYSIGNTHLRFETSKLGYTASFGD